MTIEEIQAELRAQGAYMRSQPFDVVFTLLGSQRDVSEAQAREYIAAVMPERVNTVKGREELEAEHSRRVSEGKRRVYDRQARVTFEPMPTSWHPDVQAKADQIEIATLKGEIEQANRMLGRFPHNRIRPLGNRLRRTIARMQARIDSLVQQG